MTDGPLAIGLVGCGAVAHANYAQTLIGRREYAVRYVCDTNAEQAASAAELFGAEATSLEQLAARADVVVVSTPPSTHAAILRSCLGQAGTVLCEKPFLTSRAEAEQICELAERTGTRLYVGQFRRVFPQLELARKLVDLGLIGELRAFSASEGGRFTWKAVSGYTTQDALGGVLWDTGAHTIDMALFAGALDVHRELDLKVTQLERDKAEPSHDLRAEFVLAPDADRRVTGRVHVSRKHALPNLIRLHGTDGDLAFSVGLDDRVRISTKTGSSVIRADRAYTNVIECFDIQVRRIMLGYEADVFSAHRFLGQVQLMEELTRAS